MILLNLSFLPEISINTALAKENLGSGGELQRDTVLNGNNSTEQSINLNNKELEALKAKKIEQQSLDPKISDNKLYSEKVLQKNSKQKINYISGEILVKYKNNKINLQTVSGRTTALNFINSKSLEKKEDLRNINTSILKIKDSKTVEQKIAELKNDPNVEYAQPNFQYYPTAINTNDANRDLLWGLDNTSQTINGSYGNITGTNDADIDAPEAWAINEGTNSSIIVAVIDDGVAYNHPDLINNMWDGANCKDENGGALGGCIHGYDYENNDRIPLPTNDSHGTHVAGIIAATKNNSKGIVGVAPHAKIMAIKISYTTLDIVKSINFAKQNGAKIINASLGGPNFDQALKDAIAQFPGLFITSAGNESTNNESFHSYPSDYNLDNIISVAATDQNDNLANFSNYGATSVDVGAPGTNIYSTIPSEETVNSISENFTNVTLPGVPSGWIKNGYWGTFPLDDGAFWGNVLYGDYLNTPYVNNANSTITLPTVNLNSSEKVYVDFWTKCDTEYFLKESAYFWTDYMTLELSSNGTDFIPALFWNEAYIDSDYPNSDGGSVYHFQNLEIPAEYYTGNFKMRFRWVTDSSNVPDINYDGCLIDDLKLVKHVISDGSDEKYGYMDGTSMAAPHVAGLAALIEGYKPELTSAEVKSIILDTGDSKPGLVGKTVSGKRINAFNALNSLVPATHTISGTVKYYDGVKVVPGAMVILENSVGAKIATTTTNASGSYQFTGVANGGDYVVRLSKSDNASGLSSADQIKIGRHIVGLELFNTIYKTIAGDVNNSGGLTSADQIKIGRFIVGLDSNLPSGAWKFYSSGAIPTTTNYLTLGLTRTFTNLTADTPNQDFIGIKMGDVNNSWVSN